jgi:hypothetical protein
MQIRRSDEHWHKVARKFGSIVGSERRAKARLQTLYRQGGALLRRSLRFAVGGRQKIQTIPSALEKQKAIILTGSFTGSRPFLR